MKNILKSQKMNIALVRATLFTVAVSGATASSAEVVVVVSARSTVSSLTAAQITKIFLGKTNIFPDGSNAVPLDQAEGAEVRSEFYAKVTNKDAAQLNAYWSKIIFAGDGQQPKVVSGNAGVRKAVASNPNAIGYIDRSAVDDSVKVLLTP